MYFEINGGNKIENVEDETTQNVVLAEFDIVSAGDFQKIEKTYENFNSYVVGIVGEEIKVVDF